MTLNILVQEGRIGRFYILTENLFVAPGLRSLLASVIIVRAERVFHRRDSICYEGFSPDFKETNNAVYPFTYRLVLDSSGKYRFEDGLIRTSLPEGWLDLGYRVWKD